MAQAETCNITYSDIESGLYEAAMMAEIAADIVFHLLEYREAEQIGEDHFCFTLSRAEVEKVSWAVLQTQVMTKGVLRDYCALRSGLGKVAA